MQFYARFQDEVIDDAGDGQPPTSSGRARR